MRIIRFDCISPLAWDAFVDAHVDGWWWHRSEWLAYQRLYRPAARDISCAIVQDDGTIVGIVPMLAENGTAYFDGQPAPIFLDEATKRRFWPLISQYAVYSGLSGWIVNTRPFDPRAFIVSTGEGLTRVIDVDRPVGALWHEVRRSYHSLIHQAERRFLIETHTKIAGELLAGQCADLHEAQAGRRTRPFETWQMMDRWACAGHGLVVTAKSHRYAPQLDGFIYLICYKDWAYYASGATRVPNLNHALQWTAMNALANLGITHYEMGALPQNPTEKERSIQMFKEGFGGEDWPVLQKEMILGDA